MSEEKSTFALVREIRHVGGCSQPIRLRGEFVNVATGEVAERPVLVACKDRRATVCSACSYLYKADAWILVSAGLIGGKGVPESVNGHPRLFITLTAPSFGVVHTRRKDGSCQPRPQRPCRHGYVTMCKRSHVESDPLVGTPLCPKCYDYRGAVLWNAESSRLWNRTFEQTRRRLAIERGVTTGQLSKQVRLSYLKVAEFQRRGLVHFHIVLRADGAGEPFSPPPSFLTTSLLTQVITTVVRHFSLSVAHGDVRWGRQLHVADASALNRDDMRIAAYVAKYATKTTDGSLDFARRFRSRAEIQKLDVAPHLKRLALTTWDMALEPNFAPMNLRSHAHAFGVRSQLITKSRHYSTRFQDLREVRARYMKQPESDDPIAGTFRYDGRGYDDPRAEAIAVFLHQLSLEARKSSNSNAAATGDE
ncbi:MAG: replication initiator [Acidimicrobiales bacterium]